MAQSALSRVAYFSMEFMLSEALPIYSGGLGNVAGDQLKAAHDLGVPVIGVGLLYQQGYFRQLIDEDGVQQAVYPYNDPGQLPITPLRQPSGEWLRLKMDLPGHSIWVRAWQARVGRSQLFLLDANDAANHPPYRGITAEFYGGGPELRLMQEMLLGIGGWQLLTALGIEPEVCHLNEGHAAFVVLERARSFMADTSVPFDVALAVTRKMSRSNSTPWVRGVRIPCANLCDARKTGRRPTARLSTARPCRRLGRPMISPRASCRITPAHPCRSRPPISSGNDDVLRPEVCVRS